MLSNDFLNRLRVINACLCPEPNNYWSVTDIYDEYIPGFDKDICKALEQAEENYIKWLGEN